MKIVAVICARSNSTRFPNKMMALLQGKPLLHHVVYRAKKAKLVDKVAVATVVGDNPITTFCSRKEQSQFRLTLAIHFSVL